jgi:hypothetical protein
MYSSSNSSGGGGGGSSSIIIIISRMFKTRSGLVNAPSGGKRENKAFLHKILLHAITNFEG